ncbi:hypothetical protein MNBD_GAMMA09-3248 [hydrothermal vent metagenome]|uniref:Uncharacterized protein n=1 Tax=hydrothermal vent metagenome TaxID=652676 RepID=A0A3B0Y1A6_9ZZZZ
MKSNLEKYTKVSFIQTLNETTNVADTNKNGELLLSPGAYPVCSKCGKDCKTLANEKNHSLTGTVDTLDSPMVCQSCKSVICEECARGNEMGCGNCSTQKRLSMLIPFVFCDTCGKRAALISFAKRGEATYMQLDQGAVPLRCPKCQAINCVTCLADKKGCKKCGASELELFVPTYDGAGTVIAAIDPSRGFITLAAPGTEAAKKAKAIQEKAQEQAEKEKQKDESDSCFIATAAYGTKDAKDVVCLRKFRDEVLKQSNIGKVIVKYYELLSPPLARKVRQSNLSRKLVRMLLIKPSSYVAFILLKNRNNS